MDGGHFADKKLLDQRKTGCFLQLSQHQAVKMPVLILSCIDLFFSAFCVFVSSSSEEF